MTSQEQLYKEIGIEANKVLSSLRGQRRRAWRAYAAAAITGMAVRSQDSHDDIPVLCHTALEIADEMVKREAERFDDDEEN